MHHIRAAVATTLVITALICGSIAFGKPKTSWNQAHEACCAVRLTAWHACMEQHDDSALCHTEATARYSQCMDDYGYQASSPGKMPKLPKGPYVPGFTPTPSPGTSPVTTGTNAKKPTPTPTPKPKSSATPSATPKKKKGGPNNH